MKGMDHRRCEAASRCSIVPPWTVPSSDVSISSSRCSHAVERVVVEILLIGSEGDLVQTTDMCGEQALHVCQRG